MGVNVTRRPQLVARDPALAEKISGAFACATPNGAGVALEAYAVKPQRLRVTLTNVAVAITDSGGAAGGQGALKILDFAAGLISILGAESNCAIVAAANITATAAVIASVGTAAAGAGDSTLTGTEADIIPSTACTLTGSAGVFDGEATTPALFNGTAAAIDAFLNFAVPDAGISASSSITVTGYVDVWAIVMGDND
jgi:hypothetical protein